MKDLSGILAELQGLTEREERLFLQLLMHRGLERAVPGRKLASQLNISERELREVISHLRRWHALPIGTSTLRGARGYFLITNAEEARLTTRHLWKRVINILKIIGVIEKKMLPELLGQLRFEWGERNGKKQ
jgi:biotin operon repressor